ncbi:hypothetical protein [Chromobacterium haemolyticum]|uniref:hypothetical protein n=1 Tax=Chromobacterium haemolyticum TaxID=394935 RepID=UPI000D31706C|nr:hypothetical protein DBB33_15615 [Chromobacterium haemolyticum]
MGGAKRELIEFESLQYIAIDIAVRAEVLKRCEFHDDCTYTTGEDIQGAYKLANTMYSSGDLRQFSSRRQMTDIIKQVVEDNDLDECPRCAEYYDED